MRDARAKRERSASDAPLRCLPKRFKCSTAPGNCIERVHIRRCAQRIAGTPEGAPMKKRLEKSTAFRGVCFMRSPSGFLRGYVIFERFSRFFRVFYSIPFRIIKAIHEKSQRARRHNARTPKPETGKFLFGFRKNR